MILPSSLKLILLSISIKPSFTILFKINNCGLFLDSINNFESKKVKIQVYKPGLSSFIFKFAHNFSFMYGLFSAIIAISLGLSAGLLFRKYL